MGERLPRGSEKQAGGVGQMLPKLSLLIIVVILDKEVSYDMMEKDRELAENSNVQDQDKVRWERY